MHTRSFRLALAVPTLERSLRHADIIVCDGRRGGTRTRPTATPQLDFTAGDVAAGGALTAASGTKVQFAARVVSEAGDRVEVLADGKKLDIEIPALTRADETRHFDVTATGKPVRGADGKLRLIGNPIYLNTGRRLHP